MNNAAAFGIGVAVGIVAILVIGYMATKEMQPVELKRVKKRSDEPSTNASPVGANEASVSGDGKNAIAVG